MYWKKLMSVLDISSLGVGYVTVSRRVPLRLLFNVSTTNYPYSIHVQYLYKEKLNYQNLSAFLHIFETYDLNQSSGSHTKQFPF